MYELLSDPFAYEFMRKALIVTVTASVVCAVLSCWLVLIGWSLMGDAVSHAVLPGVVLSYVLGVPFALGAFVFGCGAVGLIAGVRNYSRVKSDAAIGVVFTVLFALGLVLSSATPSQVDLQHILFGNVLGVRDGEMWQVIVFGVIALAVVLAKWRDLTLFSFDATYTHAIGLSAARLNLMLLAVLAITVVVGLQAVGIVLVVAMLVIPGATAYLLCNRMATMLVVAPIVATVASLVGLYLSFYADVSSGGMVVLAQGVTFATAYFFAPQRGLITVRVVKALH